MVVNTHLGGKTSQKETCAWRCK